MNTGRDRTTSAVIAGALIGIVAGTFLLVGAGRWGTSTAGQVVTVSTMLLAVVALPTVLRGGSRWAIVVALVWAGIAGLILGGLGAVPEPYAADIGPQPMVDEILALGGPRVEVAILWVVSAIVGLAAVAVEVRRAGRAERSPLG